MKKFIISCILFSIPLWIVLVPYIWMDPFKVLYHYDNYYVCDGRDWTFDVNRGYVSTQMYIQNKDKYHYDSFIFGSSRSLTLSIDEWKKYIGDSAHCFHFDGYEESLYLVHQKITYIDGLSPIQNAIVCVDSFLLSQSRPREGVLWTPHPALNKGAWFDFHKMYLQAYFDKDFLFACWKLFVTGRGEQYMFDKDIIQKQSLVDNYNIVYNETGCKGMVIERYPDEYYDENGIVFPQREEKQGKYPQIINEQQKAMLKDIKGIFAQNKTQYKILINPLYDQKKLADSDMAFLRNLFGDNLIDFSGKNEYTEDYHYFTDLHHFNLYVANEMLRIAYTNNE